MVPRHNVSRSEIYIRASSWGLHSLGTVSDSTVPLHAVSSGHVSAPPSESVLAPRERFTPGGVTTDPHLRLPKDTQRTCPRLWDERVPSDRAHAPRRMFLAL